MRRRQGFILIEALIVVAGLVTLVAILAANQRATLRETQDRLRQRRAEVAVQSALARAMAVLQAANTNLVTLNDDWAQLGENGTIEFDLSDATFRMQIVDTNSLVNLNTATQQQLLQLPITQQMIDCLLDWRETGVQPRSDGAKDSFYNGLPQPYNTRLGNLQTVDELLLVDNWTAEAIYQPPQNVDSSAPIPEDTNGNPLPLISLFTVDSDAPNTNTNGSPRVNLGQRNVSMTNLTRLGVSPSIAALILVRAPFTSFRSLQILPGMTTQTMQQLLNGATFSAATHVQGKINLNTATLAVLNTLPSMTPDIASAIVTRQSTGLTGLGDLATISGVNGILLSSLADAATVGSDAFLVRMYAASGGIGVAVEAIVSVTNGKPQVTEWNRLNTTGIPNWWDWQKETTSTLDATEVQTTTITPGSGTQ